MLNVLMGGIDYKSASIHLRERLALTRERMADAYRSILSEKEVKGAVIISTCNRTEVYLSYDQACSMHPIEALCSAIGENAGDFVRVAEKREGEDAMRHLCELACGMKSQIWGEDQIITQVKNAIAFAREQKACDSVLEVLFRNAVTAGKKVKTTIPLNSRENSVVHKALSLVQGFDSVQNVLVIGNGEIGRLTAKLLIEHGYEATMTIRRYRHGMIDLPKGCHSIEYAERYQHMHLFDAVISATLSPHYTIECAEIEKLETPPKLLIDLAVPRDIDPQLSSIESITRYDMDTIGSDQVKAWQTQQYDEANQIIDKYIGEMARWQAFREGQKPNETPHKRSCAHSLR